MKFNGLGNLCASVLSKFHALFAKARRKILKFAGKDAALNLIAYLQIAEPRSLNLDLAARNGSNKLKIVVDGGAKFRACERILSRCSTISRVLSGVPNINEAIVSYRFCASSALQMRHESATRFIDRAAAPVSCLCVNLNPQQECFLIKIYKILRFRLPRKFK